MNNTINTGLSGLLNDLNPKGLKPAPSDKSPKKSQLLNEQAQDKQLERAVARIINRLLDSLQSKKGTALLSQQAKNTPISQNIFKDITQLSARLNNDPSMKEIAGKLQALINPKNAAELEHSINNSGVFFESKLRAALNKEVLPKSFFSLISFMKNLRSSELKAQIFALGDENMDAKSSLQKLDEFINQHLKAPAKQLGPSNMLDSKQIIKLNKTLNLAQKYLAKSPDKALQIAAAVNKELDAVLLDILKYSKSPNTAVKLAALKTELLGFLKPTLLNKGAKNATTTGSMKPTEASGGAQASGDRAQASGNAQASSSAQASGDMSSKTANNLTEASAKALNSTATAGSMKPPEASGSAQASSSAQASGDMSAKTANNLTANNTAAKDVNEAKLNLLTLNIRQNPNASNLEKAFIKAANLLSKASGELSASAQDKAASIINQASSELNQQPSNAKQLANKIKALNVLLHKELKGLSNYETSLQNDELKQLRSLLKQASLSQVKERIAADNQLLNDDSKALLLKASQLAKSKGDEFSARLADKALAQIELNQLISASSAEIFTHLPFDFSELEHASVGFRCDEDDKFSACVKLDFKRLGKINAMLALEADKYLQINIMVQSKLLERALIENAQSFKQQLRKAGLIISSFFISSLKNSDYESDEHMQMGLDLRI